MLELITNTDNTSKVNLLSKVYIWSVVMEPLLFFILVSQNISGIGGNFSRILQFIVVVSLCLKLLSPNRVRIPNPFSPLYINYTYYFFFAVLAGCYGIVSGAYSLDIGITPIIADNTTFVASIINNHTFRPFFEYFITIYYFVYFVILARYLISNKEAINYFFRLFFIALFICLLIGYVDILIMLIYPETEGLPRHLSDGTTVGFRFHGIAGEPRDAFNYLMLSLGILALRDIWKDTKKLTLIWIIFIAITAMLTQSFSGLIGVVFFCFLLIIYYLPKTTLKVNLLFILLVLLAASLILLNITMSTRLQLYYNELFTVYSELDAGVITTIYIRVLNNVYPIWHLWLQIKEFDFLPSIIGNGLGSVSVVNNYYYGVFGQPNNPNAFIIRSLYETGVIGTLLFIAAFLEPLKKIYINHEVNIRVRIFMLLMLAMFFAHRAAVLYIFLGIALVVLRSKSMTTKSNNIT